MTRNQEPCQNKINRHKNTRAPLSKYKLEFLIKHFSPERLRGEEKWNENVCFVYTTIALWKFFFGTQRENSTHTRTKILADWTQIDTVTGKHWVELSICAHRLDWFEKVALKVTSKRDKIRIDDSTREKKRSHNKSRGSRTFHASEMLLALILWLICGGAADKFGGVLLIIICCWCFVGCFFEKRELPNVVWLICGFCDCFDLRNLIEIIINFLRFVGIF